VYSTEHFKLKNDSICSTRISTTAGSIDCNSLMEIIFANMGLYSRASVKLLY
jgi:hypothetical protein